ncbi:carbohydrate ABC transporter permease [Ruminococcus sp.]|uniref:carbohydrate ABC transporter permease n=1 Tax=Ruminococcus sp. TaxID=41978 RepID=UPI0025FC1A67|nr:carbohydrate ABC transporter permease [Ruminococcus sp.]MBQ8967022.1 carbohydrate ABC transporter permease [Ruminococcus sp.]
MARRKKKVQSIEKLKVSDKKKPINGSRAGDVCIFIFLVLLGAFMVFPLYYSVIQSLKPVEELFVFPPKLYVINPTGRNFSDMFRVAANSWQVPLSRYIFNSFFITIVICAANLFVCCCAAFVLSKCKFPGDKIINQIIVLALLFASNATWIMQFMVMAKLHMIDTYWALILPSISTSIGLYLMRQSMSTIHDSMVEAAKVDGAGLFRICWQIVVPNSKPALMTLIIFAFQGAWNMQGGALTYSEELKTLPTVVQQISAAGLARQGVTFASSVVLLIPPLLVFLVAQGNVMETMANSGMKD